MAECISVTTGTRKRLSGLLAGKGDSYEKVIERILDRLDAQTAGMAREERHLEACAKMNRRKR
jgi:hypothetical protein